MTRRVVFGSYLVRYPLGGMMSYVLQYLVGLRDLGYEVVFVERGDYPGACYDPLTRRMTDDPAVGLRMARKMFRAHGLGEAVGYVDLHGEYHGLSREFVEASFRDAVFIDMGTHGSWLEDASRSAVRILIDGEPGYNQVRMARGDAGRMASGYDLYFTNGRNVGLEGCPVPTAGVSWLHLFHPVAPELFPMSAPPRDGSWTTIMNWKAHDLVEWRGRTYGQKDASFEKFMSLPSASPVPLELAVSGEDVPTSRLETRGWRVRDAHETTRSIRTFKSYLSRSRGEFAVCKEVFVALRTGWFSDRSGAYLASGRPVVMQDTGFGDHLPTGEGLFAVQDVQGAAAALETVESAWGRHSRAARRIALEYLDSRVVVGGMLHEAGLI